MEIKQVGSWYLVAGYHFRFRTLEQAKAFIKEVCKANQKKVQ